MIKADSTTGIAETTMATDGNGVHAIGTGTTTTGSGIRDGMVIGQTGIRDGLATTIMIAIIDKNRDR
jgi:hypothetical protein